MARAYGRAPEPCVYRLAAERRERTAPQKQITSAPRRRRGTATGPESERATGRGPCGKGPAEAAGDPYVLDSRAFHPPSLLPSPRFPRIPHNSCCDQADGQEAARGHVTAGPAVSRARCLQRMWQGDTGAL
ncbi:hypothetical protein SKAU_G00309770 [Synaphobranchus kaupii]|uniref:Uncharacterized protein n=1 Tax=Synaphobranchus kaupii TaxID=118154 RepID=A0A9Q1IKX8_SYNKA|nr:hypothetical protein SKAU_G00309770 [Synaphobranchus kaupii]